MPDPEKDDPTLSCARMLGGHILQIARIMARGYASDVGPWARYLSVMAGVRDR